MTLEHLPSTSSLDGVADARPRFAEWTLRRLYRLHCTAVGAQEAAQAAAQAAQNANQRFQEGLAEACDEIGVSLPPGPAQAQIDWRTGAFSLGPPQPEGPIGGGA